MLRRLASFLLVFTWLSLGTGLLAHLHDLQHQFEDRHTVSMGRSHGQDNPAPVHDESNCAVHAILHLPALGVSWVPLLICLGLFVAFLTELPIARPSQPLPSQLECRGPPAC